MSIIPTIINLICLFLTRTKNNTFITITKKKLQMIRLRARTSTCANYIHLMALFTCHIHEQEKEKKKKKTTENYLDILKENGKSDWGSRLSNKTQGCTWLKTKLNWDTPWPFHHSELDTPDWYCHRFQRDPINGLFFFALYTSSCYIFCFVLKVIGNTADIFPTLIPTSILFMTIHINGGLIWRESKESFRQKTVWLLVNRAIFRRVRWLAVV